MRRNWRISMLASVCVLALMSAACGEDEPGPGGGDAGDLESTTLTIIAAPPEFDSITDAKWFDLLEEAGLTVKILEFEFGPDTTRALVSGEGDIASTSPLPVMQYLQEAGEGLKVVAAEILKTDYILMTTPDITSLDQLEGKKVGISEPGDISDSLTRVMLEEAGVDISTVDFVQIGGTSDRIAALSAGEISAGAAHAADGYAAAEAAGLTPLANYWEYIPVYAQRFITVSDGWLEENPNLAELVVSKLLEANQWAVDNKDEYIALSQEYVEEMSDDIRSDVYDLFLEEGFFAPDGGLEAVDATIEVERAQGTISGDLPDPSEWVIRTLVE